MANGTPDFSVQQRFPIASVAQLLAQRRSQAQQQAFQEEQARRQKKQQDFSNLLSAIQLGSGLVNQGLAISAQRQRQSAINELSGLLQKAPTAQQAQLPSMVGAGQAFGQESTVGQQFQGQVQGAALRAGGGIAQAASQNIFREPIDTERREVELNLERARTEALRRGPAGGTPSVVDRITNKFVEVGRKGLTKEELVILDNKFERDPNFARAVQFVQTDLNTKFLSREDKMAKIIETKAQFDAATRPGGGQQLQPEENIPRELRKKALGDFSAAMQALRKGEATIEEIRAEFSQIYAEFPEVLASLERALATSLGQ